MGWILSVGRGRRPIPLLPQRVCKGRWVEGFGRRDWLLRRPLVCSVTPFPSARRRGPCKRAQRIAWLQRSRFFASTRAAQSSLATPIDAKKASIFIEAKQFFVPLRKERDSNPRIREDQRFSRPPQSTTLPSFLSGTAPCNPFLSCGKEGIRTPETLLAFTHFPGEPVQPLLHLSFSRRQR